MAVRVLQYGTINFRNNILDGQFFNFNSACWVTFHDFLSFADFLQIIFF